MTIEDDIAFLEKAATLQMLGPEALRILAIGAESRQMREGEVLFSKGDTADAGYVVQEGSFKLSAAPDGRQKDVTVGPGSLLGEVALIRETRRPVTATALEPSVVIRISRSLFLKMLEGYPEAAQRLRDILAARARTTARDMVNIQTALDYAEKQR